MIARVAAAGLQGDGKRRSVPGAKHDLRYRRLTHAWAGAVVLLPVLALPAEPPRSATPAPRFLDGVEVRIASLEVRVTDRRGRPIPDLRREDFLILEDGKAREITNFLAVGGRHEGGSGPIEPEQEWAVPASGTRGVVRLALFIDSLNLHVFNRRWVLRELMEFVGERPPEIDEIAVVSFDGRLRFRQTFTADEGRVAQALTSLEREAPRSVHREMARRQAEQAVTDAQSEGQALSAARAHAAEVLDGAQRTMLALREVVAVLAGGEGRSILLVVSDGFQLRAAEELFERVAARFRSGEAAAEARSFDAAAQYAELAAYANASGVTFYALGATGVQPPGHATAQHASPFSAPPSSRQVQNWRAMSASMLEMMRTAGLREPLEGLAGETGGRALINSVGLLDDLRQLAADYSSYYWLGFEPAPPHDGRERRVEVQVRRGGARVRHRSSLRLKSDEERSLDRILAAVHGAAAANPLGLKVSIAPPPYRRSGESVLVPLVWLVPRRALILAARDGEMVGQVELSAVARDGTERLSSPVSMVREVRLPPEGPPGEMCVLGASMELQVGRNTIAFGVRDLAGSGTSTVVVEIDAVAAPLDLRR